MSEKHETNNSGQPIVNEKNHDEMANHSGASRRKFVKGVATATPIILTIASRPVWARNCSLSGQLSGNLSDQDKLPCSGEGCSIDFWGDISHTNLFHPKYPSTMLFIEAFGRDAFPGKTLLDVVQKRIANNEVSLLSGCLPTSDCRNALIELGAQAVAALENSATPVRYDLELDTVLLSFQKSYDQGTVAALQDTSNAFSNFNSQYCPLPYPL